MAVRLHVRGSHLAALVATAHFESGAAASDLRLKQISETMQHMRDESVDAAFLAVDCNLQQREDIVSRHAQGLGDDVWVLAGAPADKQWTWAGPIGSDSGNGSAGSPTPQRFDRIFLQGRRAATHQGGPEKKSLELTPGSFALRTSPDSDHSGVQCCLTLVEARESQRRQRSQKLGEPLRAGAGAAHLHDRAEPVPLRPLRVAGCRRLLPVVAGCRRLLPGLAGRCRSLPVVQLLLLESVGAESVASSSWQIYCGPVVA